VVVLHLNVNILHAGVFGGAWRLPGADGLAAYTIEHYTEIARKAERARLDAVLLADGPAPDHNVRAPRFRRTPRTNWP
jgi:alkanesulfonate monooxygenase SsuD/methylene tetrahydromethanopterin reductase-like flavin-dependent oxidoreductase (luciferase family)